MTVNLKFDTDPEALAWAREKVQRYVDKLRDFEKQATESGSGNVLVTVMDYDRPETMQLVELSAEAAARIASVMASDRPVSTEEESPGWLSLI